MRLNTVKGETRPSDQKREQNRAAKQTFVARTRPAEEGKSGVVRAHRGRNELIRMKDAEKRKGSHRVTEEGKENPPKREDSTWGSTGFTVGKKEPLPA